MPTPGPGLDHVGRRRNCRRGRYWSAVTLRPICPNPTPAPVCSKAQSTAGDYLMTMRVQCFSHSPLPMPSTFRSSSGFLNGPWLSRYSTIFSATRRPTPSSFISSLTSSVLMLTGPPTAIDAGFGSVCDGGAATAGHGASHGSATNARTRAGRMRLMEFLRSFWGSRHALERSRAMPLNPSTEERVNVQSFRHLREPIEIRLPLDRHQRLLPRVAVLAGGNDVAARRSAAADERHHVIHRQRAMADASAAVLAHTVGDTALPP